MTTYTADAVALLVYLVDRLPQNADRLFAEAEAGESVIQAPSSVLAEVLYSVARVKDVRGVTLEATATDVRRELVGNGPVSTVPVGDSEIAEFTTIVDEYSIHDALVVASHRARDTDAIITSDGLIRDAGEETIWE